MATTATSRDGSTTITISRIFDSKPVAGDLKPGEVGQFTNSLGQVRYVVGTASGKISEPYDGIKSTAARVATVMNNVANAANADTSTSASSGTTANSYNTQQSMTMGTGSINPDSIYNALVKYYYPMGTVLSSSNAPSQAKLREFANNLASTGGQYQKTVDSIGNIYSKVVSGEYEPNELATALTNLQALSKTADTQLSAYNALRDSSILPTQDLSSLGIGEVKIPLGIELAERFALPKETWNMNPTQLMNWITDYEKEMSDNSFGSMLTTAGLSAMLNIMLPGAGSLISNALGSASTNVVNSALSSVISGLQNDLSLAEIAQNAALAGGGAYVGSVVGGVLDDVMSGGNVSPGIQLGYNAAGEIVDATTGQPFTGAGVNINAGTPTSLLSPGISLTAGAGLNAANNALTQGMDEGLANLLNNTPVNAGQTVGDLLDVQSPNLSTAVGQVDNMVTQPITTGATSGSTGGGGLLDTITNNPIATGVIGVGAGLIGNEIIDALTPEQPSGSTWTPFPNNQVDYGTGNMLGMPDWWNNLYSRGGFGAGNYLGYDIMSNQNIPLDVQSLLGMNSGQTTGSTLTP